MGLVFLCGYVQSRAFNADSVSDGHFRFHHIRSKHHVELAIRERQFGDDHGNSRNGNADRDYEFAGFWQHQRLADRDNDLYCNSDGYGGIKHSRNGKGDRVSCCPAGH